MSCFSFDLLPYNNKSIYKIIIFLSLLKLHNMKIPITFNSYFTLKIKFYILLK